MCMDRKYKIVSANSIVSMNIIFNDKDDSKSINVLVDYFNQKIFFGDVSLDLDYEELEKEILDYLRPPLMEKPNLPESVFKKILEVKSGQYQRYKDGQI